MKQPSSRLQSRSRLASASLVLVLLAAARPAFAATQYWDPGLTPAANSGTGSGGDGTWTSAGANWSNGSTDAVLTATNVAGFAASAGNVTLTTVVGTGGLKFDTSNYVIGNGTNTGQITVNAQTSADGISVSPGVTGTVIDIGGIRLGSVGSGTTIQLTNTDLVDFKNTTIYLSGSRVTKITNSSAGATTTFSKFAVSDKPGGGTWPNANLALEAGNLVINTLASASANATTGALATYNSTTVVNTTFSGNSTGTLTLAGNNTLFHNGGAGGQLTLTVNMGNATLALGHDNALGAVNGSGAATNTAVLLQAGTLAASGGARTIANAITLTGGNGKIGGANNITFSGNVTNSGGSRTLTVTNTAATTLSGSVFLSESAITGRTLTIAGAGNTSISGAISNFNGSGVAGGLTKTDGGTLTLSSAVNSYTGTTTISGGVLALGADNALSSGSALSLGAGTLDLETFSAAAPSLALTSASAKLGFDLAGRPIDNGTAFLALSGAFTEASDLSGYTVDFGGSTVSSVGAYKLLSFGSITGTLLVSDFSIANLNLSGVTASLSLSGGDLSLVTVSAVPEPASFAALAGLAGMGFAATRRRRR
jgi:autotransporter-associated beta strand protein